MSRRLVAFAIAVGLVAAACGSESVAGSSLEPTSGGRDDAGQAAGGYSLGTDPADGWCATYEAILSFTGDVSGPEQQEAEQLLARFVELAPDDLADEAGRLGTSLEQTPAGADAELSFARDLATVAEYAERECGTDPPFCAIFPLLSFYVASTAFAGGDPTGDAVQVIKGYVDLALEYLPDGLADDEAVLRRAFTEEVDGDDEREAEAAVDRAEAWAASPENCPFAATR